jgi:hypothetical protein
MSVVICAGCDRPIDSDDDPECFGYVGNMRREAKEVTMCQWCRDDHEELWRSVYDEPPHPTSI